MFMVSRPFPVATIACIHLPDAQRCFCLSVVRGPMCPLMPFLRSSPTPPCLAFQGVVWCAPFLCWRAEGSPQSAVQPFLVRSLLSDFWVAAPSLVSVIGIMSPPKASTVARFLIRLVTFVDVIVDHLVVCPGLSGGPTVGGGGFPCGVRICGSRLSGRRLLYFFERS